MTDFLDNLIVYQASAGSGKTYRLVLEYLTLLFEGIHNINRVKYDAILVVTFTNKATVELRERILKMLSDLSQGRGPMKADLLQAQWDDSEKLAPPEKERRLKAYASRALKEILEDYAHFRVQTIDSFFQEVVRSFVLEMDRLHSGFEIELDKDSIVALSLEDMLREMSRSATDKELEEAVRLLFEAKKDEDERVKFKQELSSMMSLFIDDPLNERVLETKSDYLDRHTLGHAIQKLSAIKSKIETRVLDTIKDTADFLSALPFEPYNLKLEDTSYKTLYNLSLKLDAATQDLIDLWTKGPYSGLAGSRLRELLEKSASDPGVWVSKARRSEYTAMLQERNADLRQHLLPIVEVCDDEISRRHYRSVTAMLKYLRWIPVLIKFRERIESYQRDNGIVLISKINTLLSEIISGADAPFIYEKVGTTIEHYLIDEFQDTNAAQWLNFLPLLAESLSRDNRNYIVGDVKQSIYRFRGGDSELLGSTIPHAKGKDGIRHLNRNYRSRKEIVDFNNDFFGDIYGFGTFVDRYNASNNTQKTKVFYPDNAEDLVLSAKDHREIYKADNVCQQQPGHNPKQGGFVSIKKKDLDESALSKLILKLTEGGRYRPGDIAILVRTNNEAGKIADMLNALSASDFENRDKYRYISNSALLIANNLTVQVITSFLRHLAHPGLKSAKDLFEVALYNYIPFNPDSVSRTKEDLVSELVEKMTGLSLTGLSLYEVVNGVAECLKEVRRPSDEELVYINAFFDRLFDFSGRYPATYGQFDEWWQSQKDSLYVEMSPTAVNAIQLHTIHTVKGLEFPVVILPYADWNIVSKGGSFGKKDIRLFDIDRDAEKDLIDETAFLSTGSAPLSYPDTPRYFYYSKTPTASNTDSIFRKTLLEELEAEYMDALNLLYVAFTRPSDRLYIYLGEKKAAGTGLIIEDRIQKKFGLNVTEKDYESGTETENAGASEKPGDEILSTLSASPRYDNLSIRKEYLPGPDQSRGIDLHRILESVADADGIDRAFGVGGSDLAEEAAAFREALSDPEGWPGFFFTAHDGCETLVEHSMYSHRFGRVLRTDRLILNHSERKAYVLDFKFGKEQKAYLSKMRKYLQTLKDMDYDARGFLWYNFQKIEEVFLS